MIAFIGGIMIVLALCMAFMLGYYKADGKVEIKRVMNATDSAMVRDSEMLALKKQMESHEQWQRMAKDFQQEGVDI